jgi:hypothetical protein
MIERKKDVENVRKLLDIFPSVALIGPRQCGKTTLSKELGGSLYFDLENPRDIARMENPQLLLERLKGLIIIDEIQHKMEIFPLLRSIIDNDAGKKFLLLGSVTGDLIRVSSESLAGRIGYYTLGGFRLEDLEKDKQERLWIRGGFPRSYLAGSDEKSRIWRDNFIKTYLERDIPQLGIKLPPYTLRRFWIMLSHYHGQILNYSELARSFGISDMTVRKYLEILSGTFMIRLLSPWYLSISKRLVKNPKIYIRDSGLFHNLQSINSLDDLLANPKLGASWEGFALENLCRSINKSDNEFFFWSTHSGAELDLLWQEHGKNWGAEFKYADAPKITRSMISTINDLKLEHLWIIYPGMVRYELSDKVSVLPLEMSEEIRTF